MLREELLIYHHSCSATCTVLRTHSTILILPCPSLLPPTLHLNDNNIRGAVPPNTNHAHRKAQASNNSSHNLTGHEALHLLPDLFPVDLLLHLFSAHGSLAITVMA